MGALLGILLPLLPGIIKTIETTFAGKPKSGTEKMTTLVDFVRGLITQLIAAKVPMPDGTVLTEQPTDDILRGALEAIFQNTKAAGQLTKPVTEGELFLVRGTVTPLKQGV